MNVEVKTLNEMTAQEWCKLAEERVRVLLLSRNVLIKKSMNRIIKLTI